jgi:cystathionine gamma-lyase
MIDCSDLQKVKAAIKPNTKLMWIESPTNPTLKCTDIAELSKICRDHGVLLAVDNTFMSPALQNPLVLGADIVMHSITKYIGGHADVVGGAIIFNDESLFDKLHMNMSVMGTIISPFDAYLALRGSKTLQLRAERSAESALKVAEFLEQHPKIEKVLYPGLPSHPHHEVALKNRAYPRLNGGSGLLSFYLKSDGDINQTDKFLRSLTLFTQAVSLGGVESLVCVPALSTHGPLTPE